MKKAQMRFRHDGLRALALLLLWPCSGVFAQEQQPAETLPGFRTNNVFETREIDNVNVFSGDAGVAVPLGPSYPLGPGSSWQLRAYYSAKFWKFDSSCLANPLQDSQPVRHAYVTGYPTLGAGWTLELGYLSDGYHSPDGATHQFSSSDSSYFYTTDGTKLREPRVGSTVEFPDGTIQTFDHVYNKPNRRPASYDFNDLDWDNLGSESRAGLSQITNRFGQRLLAVQYDAVQPWKVTSIQLDPDGQRRTIFYTWTTSTVGGVTWDVLSSVSFPVSGGGTLTASFSYLSYGGFPRSGYDNSLLIGYCRQPGQALVPLLQSIVLSGSGVSGISYGFDYLLSPTVSDFLGTLRGITLPTGGRIDYGIGNSAQHGLCLISNCPDLEQTSGGPAGGEPEPSLPGHADRLGRFRDWSAAIVSRTESGPGIPTSTTAYDRAEQYPTTTPTSDVWDTKITRRVIVTAPDGNGSAVATKYLFHVSVDGDLHDSGIELARRYYQTADADTTGTTIRSVVSCWQDANREAQQLPGICGYRDSGGSIQNYGLTDDVHRKAQYTWFGARPAGGYVCPSGPVACSASESSGYNPVAREYATTVERSALLGSPSRTTTTVWAPSTVSSWLPGLFDKRSVSQDAAPAIDRFLDFNATTGFEQGELVRHRQDASNDLVLVRCFYKDGLGNVGSDFTATVVVPAGYVDGNPKPCSGAGPYATMPTNVIGINNDAFGKQHAYQNGLGTRTNWLFSSGGQNLSIGWNGFDVNRDTATGWVTTSRDSAGVSTTYGYDALGRISQISPASESPTLICYDSSTRTTVYRAASQISPCPSGGATPAAQTWQQYLYDGVGRLIREIRLIPTPDGSYAVRTHEYDAADHGSFDSEWQSCTSPAGDCLGATPRGTRSSSFDPFGRPRTLQKADGSTTTIDYSDGSIAFSETEKTVTVNNVNGTCTGGSCSGGSPAITTFTSDLFGRLISVQEPGSDPATTYTYDVNGKLTRVTQGVQTRSFVYDSLGFLRSETTPEKGNVTYDSYGSLGNLKQRTEGDRATVVTSTFDAAARLLTQSGNGVRYLMNCYDGSAAKPLCPDGTPNFAGGSSPQGKLTRRVGSNPLVTPQPSVTDDFTYAGLGGRLSTLSTSVAGGIGQVDQGWFYNILGLVAQHSHARLAGGSAAPLVESTTYTAGLPTTLYANGLPVVAGVDYAPSGSLQHYTTGLFAGKTVTTTVGVDTTILMPRPTRISTAGASANFDTGLYTYDGVGNIKLIGSDTFGYDDRSRLTAATLSGAGSQSYTYDRFGNLLTKGATTFCGGGTCANNRITAGGYNYDSRGNLKTSPFETYTYDLLDRTITSTASKYLYDGASERVVKIDSTSAWTYTFRDESGRVSTEYVPSSPPNPPTPVRDNIFLGSQVVGSYANGGAPENTRVWSFYSSDHLGTPRLVTDAAATQVEARRYWPFGEQVVAAQPFQRIRFAAMEQDTEAGPGNDRYYDHARHHGAGLGRFLSPDKVGGRPEDPQAWNRYGYARNNPTKFVDENGQEFGYPGQAQEMRQILIARGDEISGNGMPLASIPLQAAGGPEWLVGGLLAGALRSLASATAVEALEASAAEAAPEAGAASSRATTFYGTSNGEVVPATTPAGQAISAHAAERMANPPPGRAVMMPGEADNVLATGTTKVNATNIRQATVTFQNKAMPGKPQVVVSYTQNGQIVTVMKNAQKNVRTVCSAIQTVCNQAIPK